MAACANELRGVTNWRGQIRLFSTLCACNTFVLHSPYDRSDQTQAKKQVENQLHQRPRHAGLERGAERVLSTFGVSTTEAITMFLRQVVLNRGLPFSVRIPNAETLAAIQAARETPRP